MRSLCASCMLRAQEAHQAHCTNPRWWGRGRAVEMRQHSNEGQGLRAGPGQEHGALWQLVQPQQLEAVLDGIREAAGIGPATK